MALKYSDQVGQQEDWANVITNVAMVDTPKLAWLPEGPNIISTERLYQAETYRPPSRNSHADGVPVGGEQSAGETRKELRSVIQYSTKRAGVTVLQQGFGNVAGVEDELGREIRKQTKELSKDIEAAISSAQECRVGVSGTTGYMTRGIPNWIQASPQAVYPVDSSLYPSAAQISTTATASLTEDVILNILQGMGTTTRDKQTITAFIGPTLQRIINNWPMFVPSSGSTINGGAYPSAVRGGAFDRGIVRYISPFGPVDLVLDYNNYALDSNGVAQSGTTYNTHSAFFLHQDKWQFSWGSMNGGSGKPKWVESGYEGGKRSAFCESVWMLTCLNPQGEGKYAPAS
jgi:hypothetical protein